MHTRSIHLQEHHGEMADKFIPAQPLSGLVGFPARVSEKIKIGGPFRDFWKDALQIVFMNSCMPGAVAIPYIPVTKIRIAITQQSSHSPKAHSKPIRIGKITSTLQNGNETARITPEKFVPSVSGKNDFYLTAGQTSDKHGRENGVIAEGLATRTDNVVQHFQSQFGCHMLDDLIDSNLLSIGFRIPRFV